MPLNLGAGQPLDTGTRLRHEARLGRDFSRVRVHTGSDAELSARALRARAYAINDHIVFGRGEYAPESSGGRRLLGHELTHVLQQRDRQNSGGVPVIHRSPASNTDDRLSDLRTDIEALRLPVSRPGYFEVAEQHKALLLSLVDVLIELQASGGSVELKTEAQRAAELVTDMRSWAFSSFGMPIAQRTSEALIQAGLAAEGLALWDSAYAGIEPTNALEHDKAKEEFVSTMLGNVPEPSMDDPQGSLQNLILLHGLFLAKAGLQLDPTERAFDEDAIRRLWNEMLALLTPICARVQAVVAGIIQGRVADAPQAIATVKKLLTDIGAASVPIETEEIKITMSDFGQQPVHKDFFTPEDEARQMPFEFYTPEGQQTAHELQRPVAAIIQALQTQLGGLEKVQDTSVSVEGVQAHPFENDESLRAWALQMFESAGGKSSALALDKTIKMLEAYFSAFTVHADYNLSDRNVRYLNRPFPRALTGEVLQDCGIYAMRIAYILSLVATELDLHFYWVDLPVHLALVITGPAALMGKGGKDERILYAVHNGTFFRMNPDSAGSKGTEANIGTWAAATFVPQAEPKLSSGEDKKGIDSEEVTDVPFQVMPLPEPQSQPPQPGGDVQPDKQLRAMLIELYGHHGVEVLEPLAQAGLGEAEYLGVIETYRAFAREAPARFLPVAIGRYNDLKANLGSVDAESGAAARIIEEALQTLQADFNEKIGPAKDAYVQQAQLLRKKIRGIPPKERRQPGWARAEVLTEKAELPPWYDAHMDFLGLLQVKNTAAVVRNVTKSSTNPYQEAFNQLSD